MINGLVGAFLATLFWSKSAKDLVSYEGVRNYVVGLISGYIYYLLYSEYNFPNALMCIVFGYFGKDVIETFFERLRPKHR